MPTEYNDPIIVVKLQEGLADRHRLPLNHVISVLEEVRQMVTEAGRQIQHERGLEKTTGDFGLELIAGESGILFHKGSVEAAIAITSDVSDGMMAAQKIVRTVEDLRQERERKPSKPPQEFDFRIVRRLSRIAKIQKTDKTKLELTLRVPKTEAPVPDFSAVFDQAAIDSVRALQAPTFSVANMRIFGKLVELKDRDEEEDSIHGFWGELRRENSELWRIQFKATDIEQVSHLFRKQVSIAGKAFYYRAHHPKLIAQEITLERERDYESAFDELYGCDKSLYNADLSSLLRELRGE